MAAMIIAIIKAELKDMVENSYPATEKLALCRCGASANKPSCAGTHGKVGFAVAEQATTVSAGS